MNNVASDDYMVKLIDNVELTRKQGFHALTLTVEEIEGLIERDKALVETIQRSSNVIATSHQQLVKYQMAINAAAALLDIQCDADNLMAQAIVAVACNIDTPSTWLTINSTMDKLRREAS